MSTVKIFNKGKAPIQISNTEVLKPNEFLEVSEKIANQLLGYAFIVKADEMIEGGVNSEKEVLLARITELEAENAALKAGDAKTKRADLEVKLLELGYKKDVDFKSNTPFEKLEKLIADKTA